MVAKTTQKRGKNLVAGDVLVITSQTMWTIVGFEPHPGLTTDGKHHSARVAVLNTKPGLTVFDDDFFQVVEMEKAVKRGGASRAK